MSKKILIFITLIFFLSSFNNFADSSEIEKINLEKTFRLMEKNDIDFKIRKIKLDNLILETKEKKINNSLINSKTKEKEINLNFKIRKNNYLNEKNQRLIFIAEKYFKILELKTEKNIKEREIFYERNLLETIKAEEKKGYKNKIDVFNQENNLNNSIIDSENVKSDYNQELKEFKYILGIADDKNIELNTEINYKIKENLNKIDYDEIINKKVEIKLMTEEIEILKNEIKMAEVKEIAQLKINKLENNLEIKKLEKEKFTMDSVDNLRRQHYFYKKAVNNLKMRENNLKALEENHFILSEQYKKGMIKKIDLLNSELNLLKEQANYKRSVYNYQLNLLKLKNLLGENLGVGFDV